MKRFGIIALAGLGLLLGACSQIVGAPLEQGTYDATVDLKDSDGNEESFDFTFHIDDEGRIEDDSYDFTFEGTFIDVDVDADTGNNRLRFDATVEYDLLGTEVVHSFKLRGTTRGDRADGDATYTRKEDGDVEYEATGDFEAHKR